MTHPNPLLPAIILGFHLLGCTFAAAEVSPPPTSEATARSPVAALRAERTRLLDLHRVAEGSDDDDEADALRIRIAKLGEQILDAEERLAAARNAPMLGELLPGGLASGLVLLFSFDTCHGRKVVDSSGRNNHGTVHGARWLESGRNSGAYWFDGLDDHIGVPCSGSLRDVDSLTLSVCVLRQLPLADGEFAPGAILAKSGPDSADYSLQLSANHAIGATLRRHANPASVLRVAPEPSRERAVVGEWCHLVFTYGGGLARTYLNGKPDKVVDLPGGIGSTEAPLQVGRRGIGSWSYGFTGRIDDIAIWNRALSEVEVLGLWVALKRSACDPAALGSLP